MSVTFWCPDAPSTTEVCEWCARTRKDRDDVPALDGAWVQDMDALTDDQWAQARCNPWCQGTRQVSSAPEANFANANARGVLALMGLDSDDLCGSLESTEIPAVMQRLMVAMNRDDARSHLVAPTVDRRAFDQPRVVEDPDTGLSTITRGCRVIECGNTDEHTLRRLGFVRDLLSFAHIDGYSVVWG
jgi:hypothetical protein